MELYGGHATMPSLRNLPNAVFLSLGMKFCFTWLVLCNMLYVYLTFSKSDKQVKPEFILQLIETTLRITYTGEEGSQHKYHRESLMALDTVLIPSVDVISQDITSYVL